MEPEEKSLNDYLQVLGRRRRPLIAVTALILMVAAGLAFGLPPVYRSKAIILIEQQDIPTELVRSTVTGYAESRLQIISQRVMTSANLGEIIKKYDLYRKQREKDPLEVVLEGMRKDIQIENISADVVDPRSGQPRQATIAFTLTYENETPALAQKVANELVSLFLNENLKTRTEMAAQASTFFSEEAEKLKTRVADLETQLAAFKEKNVGKLPEMININLELMDRTERDLMEIERQISSLEERRIYLESEIAKIKPDTRLYSETGERILGPADRLKVLQTEMTQVSARYAADHPDVVRLKKEIEALKKETEVDDPRGELKLQLDGARAELARAAEKYAADHPDVKRLKRTVANLEKELAAARPAAKKTEPADVADNPAYITMQANLESANTEVASLQAQRKELRTKLADLESRLTEAPQVEREYKALTRDYENALAKFQEITAKQMEAQVSQTLETERKGERFTLIEPPLLPEEPAKPNRLAIGLLGIMLSFAGGIGSAAIAEGMDSTIRGRRMVMELLGAAPLAAIPVIETAADARRRALMSVLTLAGILLAIALAALAVHLFIKPLDVLWFAVLNRLGI